MKANKIDVTQVKEILEYNSETGELTYKCHRGSKARKGDTAGHKCLDGYIVVKIKGIRYTAARLAWAIYYGEDPADLVIDHINRDRSDNRISNLRRVNLQVNASNRSVYGKGISWCKRAMKWRAQVQHDGRKRSAGYHECPVLARIAFEDKVRELKG